MNKIYKLIWSKVKNMWVAVAEIAKSHTKSPRSSVIGRTLVAGVLACVLGFGVAGPVLAAGNADDINSSNDRTVTGADVYEWLNKYGLYGASMLGTGSEAISSFASIGIGSGARVGALSNNSVGYSIAIGNNALTTGSYSASIGSDAIAYGYRSVAIGAGAQALTSDAFANDNSGKSRAVAIGAGSKAMANLSVAIGDNAVAEAGKAWVVSIGANSYSGQLGSFASGYGAKAFGKNGVAMGRQATAGKPADGSLRVNPSSEVLSKNDTEARNAVAIGYLSLANEDNAIALGYKTEATGINAIALGSGVAGDDGDFTNSLTRASGQNSMAFGFNARAVNQNSIAIGGNALTGDNADSSIAIGYDSQVTGEKSIAIGLGHRVLGNNSGTFGDPNIVNGDNSYVVGNNSTVAENTSNVFVLGNNVNTTGSNTVVLGGSTDSANKLAVTGSNSVVLGVGSDGSQSNVVSVGNSTSKRKVVNVADGASATDAATVGQVRTVSEGNGIVLTETTNTNGSKNESIAVKAGTNVTVDTNGVNVVGNGAVASADTGLISGGTAYSELRPTANGNYIATANTTAQNLGVLDSALKMADNTAIKNITSSGTTVTFTKGDGTTGTFTTQDNNTEYTAGNGLELTGTEFTAKAGTNVTIDNNGINVVGNGTVADGNTGLVSGGTLFTEGRVSADANYVRASNTIAGNLSALDTAVKTNADAITQINTGLEGKANTSLDNITNDGKSVIKTNAKEAINVKGSGKVIVDKTDVSGVDTYTVGVTVDGAVAEGNTGIIDGGAVYTALQAQKTTTDTALTGKANVALDNVTEAGHNVIKSDAKSVINAIAGTYTTISKTDVDGVDTYAVNVITDGTVMDGNTGIVTGGTVYTAVNNEKIARETADTTLQGNIDAEVTARENADTALSDCIGTLSADGNYIRQANNVSQNLSVLDSAVNTLSDGKADIALSNINNDGKTVVRNLAKEAVKVVNGTNTTVTEGTDGEVKTYAVNVTTDGVIVENNTGLVTGGTVYTALNAEKTARETADTTLQGNIDTEVTARENADTALSERITTNASDIGKLKDLSNITDAGKTVVRDLAKGSVNVVGNGLASVAKTNAEGVDTYTVSVVADGEVADGNAKLVNGGVVYTAIQNAVSDLNTDVQTALAGKANVALDNVTDAGHAVIKSDAKSVLNVVGGNYATVDKADVNGVDTYTVNVATDGAVVDGNTKLVTGATVYQAIQDAKTEIDTKIANGTAYFSVNSTETPNRDGKGATGVDAMAIGDGASASGNSSAALGDYADAKGLRSIALGNSAGAEKDYGIAIGGLAKVKADGGIAMGTSANVTGANAVALGNSAKAEGATSYAIGQGADAKGESSIAFGTSSESATTGVAMGHMAKATGESGVALGTATNAGKTAVAIGHGANAGTEAAMALGVNASATQSTAVAIGMGSTATEANTVSFGNASTKRRVVNIAEGDADSDAVAMSQLKALQESTNDGLDTKANLTLNNINDAGKTVIRDLAKGSVKVVNGTHTTVTEGTDGLATTYAVNVTTNGEVVENNTGIVTGGTVYNAVHAEEESRKAADTALSGRIGSLDTDKNYVLKDNSVSDNLVILDTQVKRNADDISSLKDMSNLTTSGETVIKNLSKGSVNVVGDGKASVVKTDVNGVDTYTVTVNADGAVVDGNTDLVSGGTVYNAVHAEQVFRENADNALSERIGSVTADGNYISKSDTKSVSENLFALDTAIKTVADNASASIVANKTRFFGVNSTNEYDMNYDGGGAVGTNAIAVGPNAWADSNDSISIGNMSATMFGEKAVAMGYGATALEENAVAVGPSAQASNKFGTAVGSNAAAAGWSSTAIGKNALASGKNSIAVGSDSTATGEDEFSVGRPAVEANAETGQTAQPEVKRRITHVDTGVNDTDAVNVKQLDDALYDKADWNAANIGRNLVLADDEYPDGMTDEQKSEYLANMRQYNLQSWGQALGAGTVTGGDSRLVTGDTVHVEVRPSENGTYVKTNNTTGQNLLALDQQLSTVLEGNASQDTAISDLQNEMETKANVGLDNITDAGKTVVRDLAKESVKVVNGTNTTVTEGTDGNAKTYAVNAVTDGAVADGNTGIVTGGTVYSAIQDMIASSDTIDGKANVALDNVTEAGHTVIKTDAKSVVNVIGNSDVTVTKTDVDGVDTYNVAVVKTGTVTDGNEGIVTGDTVYDALRAETRPAADGNYIAADHTAGANLTVLDTQVKTNADAIAVNTTDITNLKDLSNITDAGQTVVKNLAKGSVNVVGTNKAAVTKTDVNGVDTYTVDVKADAGKANVELDNVTAAGHTVIKMDAKSAINVAGGTNADVVKTDVNGVDTYTVNVAGNGQVAENNTGLMNGGAVYSELRPTDGNYVRKDATTAANLSALDTKIGTVTDGDFVQASNTVGQNLNALDEALYDKANWDASNVGRNTVVTDDDYPAGLTDEQKAEYAANLREYNLQSWGQALGAGTVKGGDSRLITGDTLHVEVRPANSGTYVKVDKTTGENLLALDEQLSSVVNGASAQNTTINNLENEMANKANIALDNINADGVNVVRNIAKSAVVVADGPNTTVSSSTDTDGNITYRVTANATGSITDGNTGLVDGGTVYAAIENAKNSMSGEIGGLDSDGNYIRKANTVAENLVALDTQVKTNADGLVTEQTARETADTALSDRIGTLTADGNYIAKDSPVSENLSSLDTAVKSVRDKADSNTTEITNLKDLSNITAAGATVIKNLAKGSVKVINGTRTTVTEGADGDIKTFAVNVDANGTVTNGNTGLVTGGTVKSALDALSGSLDTDLAGKANVSLDNVSGAGHAVIKSDAKSAINVVGGQYATVAKTDVNGVNTYTVNVATDGSVADGNRKLVTGGTVYNALQDVRGSVNTSLAGKANTSLDNLDVDGMGRVRDIAKTAVSVANGAHTTASSVTDADGNVVYKVNVATNGSIASGNAGIMSGGTMYDELRPANGNYVARSSTTAANLTALDAAVKEAMTKAETAQAVTGGNAVVYDTDDRSSVTLGGADGTAIHNVANGAVTADSKDAVTGGQLYTVKSVVDANRTAIAGLDTKIQDHTTAIAGLDTRVQDNATAIVGLDTRVQDNTTAIDTLRTTVTNGLDGKTDTDLGNLTDAGKDVVRDLAKESVRVADGVNTTIRTTVDGDAFVYHVDVAANGRVESGNTGIVTGDAVYEAIRDIEINASDTHYVSINPSEKDDETFANHGASGKDAVAIGAKSYASGDESVAIGHNNDVSGNETYVIGSDVNATGNNSVVLGKGSDGSLDNVVSVGSAENERRIVHVADGKLSADSKDAVNGKQLYEVREKLQNAEGIDVDKWSDALGAGSVAPDDERLVKGSTVYSAIQSTGISLSPDGSTMNVGAANNATVVDFTNSEGNGRVLQGIVTDPGNPNSAANVGYVNAIGQNIVNGVNNGLNRLDTKIDKVGAGAAALASLAPMPFDDDQKWSVSAAIGTYHGTQAGAVGVFYKPQDNVMLNIRGAIGNGENMGGAGLSIGLNKGAAKGLSKASMAKTMNAQANEIVAQKQLIQNQQAQLDAQKAEIEELKQMVRSVVASKQVDK